MAVPAEVMVQLISELRSYGEQMRQQRARALAIMEKVNSNGLGTEAAPAGEDVLIADIRTAYTHLVIDYLAFMANGTAGQADRITSLWKMNRRQSV
jgi:hypothetical protein